MKKFLKLTALLCACLMLVSVFAGCGNNGDDPVESTAPSSDVQSNTESAEETRDNKEEIGKHDFNQKTFNILARKSTLYEYYVEYTSDISTVGKQVYERNKEIESRFNVVLNVMDTPCDDANRADFTTLLANDIASGAASYHLASGHGTVISPQQFQGHCVDLNKLPEFNPAKTWWSEEFYNECNFGGKLYFAVGDIAYTMYQYLQVLFVNETEYEAKQIGTGDVDDLYKLVTDGEWTWATFQEYAKNYAGGVDMGADTQEYGVALNLHSFRAFLPAFESTFTYREADGTIKLYETPTEKMVTIFDQMQDFFLTRADMYCPNVNGNEAKTQNALFSGNRVLFYGQELGQATALRDMTDKYGILPFPKYDELQQDYYTTCRNSVSAVMVPSNVAESDYEMVGTIVEAMSMYGYQKIVPAYYDQVLSKQILADANGQAMLELIRKSFMIDFSLAYTFGFGSTHPYTVYKRAFFQEGGELTSQWATDYDLMKGSLETMYTNIQSFQ